MGALLRIVPPPHSRYRIGSGFAIVSRTRFGVASQSNAHSNHFYCFRLCPKPFPYCTNGGAQLVARTAGQCAVVPIGKVMETRWIRESRATACDSKFG